MGYIQQYSTPKRGKVIIRFIHDCLARIHQLSDGNETLYGDDQVFLDQARTSRALSRDTKGSEDSNRKTIMFNMSDEEDIVEDEGLTDNMDVCDASELELMIKLKELDVMYSGEDISYVRVL
jgi:hypothetical protein